MSSVDIAILVSVLALVGTLGVGLMTLLGKRGDQEVSVDQSVNEQERQMRAELRVDVASARSERDAVRLMNDKLGEQNGILAREVIELQKQNDLLRAEAELHATERAHDKAKLEVMAERISNLEAIIDNHRNPSKGDTPPRTPPRRKV